MQIFFFYFLFTKACTDIVQNYSPLFTKAWMQVLPVWDKKSSLHFLLFHYFKMQHIVPGSHADFVFIFYLLHCVKVRSVLACTHTHTHTHTHTLWHTKQIENDITPAHPLLHLARAISLYFPTCTHKHTHTHTQEPMGSLLLVRKRRSPPIGERETQEREHTARGNSRETVYLGTPSPSRGGRAGGRAAGGEG